MADLRHRDNICEVWQGDAREVAAGLAPGSCSLAILDGPYGLLKAGWDRQGVDGLPDWYRPHLEDVERVCAPSASLYVWNTAEGWARLDPLIRSMGWRFRVPIVWDNASTIAVVNPGVQWPRVTEFCGFYTRGKRPVGPRDINTNVWRTTLGELHREKLVGPKVVRSTTVYTSALHPSQKPVAFARRMIEASTRPGERVWVPFGGTLRECIAARDIAREDPEAARYVITAELNQDGPDYIGAALRQYHGQGTRPRDPRQGLLFD